MSTPGQTAAKESLARLEADFVQYCQEEQNEIEALRYVLRSLIHKHDSSAKLAIIAVGLEISIAGGQ